MAYPADAVHLRARRTWSAGRACCCVVLMACAQAALWQSAAAQAVSTPRVRVSLNADWRFQRGDPAESAGRLAYEKIKDWVNATGLEFVTGTDAPKRARPEEALGGDVSYARRDFDDRNWRQLDLPHDWGIEGPFRQ